MSAKLLSSAAKPISYPAAGGVSMRISMITPCRSVIHQPFLLSPIASAKGNKGNEVLSGTSGEGLVCETQTTRWSKRAE